ncbi:MAG: hypothetical protein ABL997_13030, partial [Planctomycetota bacterium]
MLHRIAWPSLLAIVSCISMAALGQEAPGRGPEGHAAAPLPASSSDPALDALLARLSGANAAVGEAIAKVASPAARARLQAAFGPASQRAMAMLAVARIFQDDPEADLALFAAAAALLERVGRGDAVPELALWGDQLDEEETRHSRARSALLPVLLGIRSEIAARRARGGDAKVLDEAEALLAIASVSRTSESVWLRREARFSTPLDLRESIELAWHPRAMEPEPGSWSDYGQLEWNELRALAEPVQRVLLEPGKAANAGAVPYGHYLFAVRAKATPWWGLAPIEVSDLEALAVIEDQALVLATWAEGGAAAVRYELGTQDLVTRGDLDGRAKVLAFDPAENHVGIRHELRLASDFG